MKEIYLKKKSECVGTADVQTSVTADHDVTQHYITGQLNVWALLLFKHQ
jgi:hypothetical protein